MKYKEIIVTTCFAFIFVIIGYFIGSCTAYANEVQPLPGTEMHIFEDKHYTISKIEIPLYSEEPIFYEDDSEEAPIDLSLKYHNAFSGLIGIPVPEPVCPVPDDMWGATRYLMQMGVVYQYGYRYTWYSQRVLPGYGLYELNNNGRWVDQYGLVRDGEGYISVASSDWPKLTIVPTPLGPGKVYDCGCASGTIDIYVSW